MTQIVLYVNGDSLAVGTMWTLPRYLPGWRIIEQTKVGKATATGVSEILAVRGHVDAVFVNLGTNDDPDDIGAFERAVDRVVRWADGRPILWANVHRPPIHGHSYDGFNRLLNAAMKAHPNFTVYYWHRLASRHPEWFGHDHIHPNEAGYRARAKAIASILKRRV